MSLLPWGLFINIVLKSSNGQIRYWDTKLGNYRELKRLSATYFEWHLNFHTDYFFQVITSLGAIHKQSFGKVKWSNESTRRYCDTIMG